MQGLEPSGLQFVEIILVELGHLGLTVNPIIPKDMCRFIPPPATPFSPRVCHALGGGYQL
jgi:hypothetical protein